MFDALFTYIHGLGMTKQRGKAVILRMEIWILKTRTKKGEICSAHGLEKVIHKELKVS